MTSSVWMEWIEWENLFSTRWRRKMLDKIQYSNYFYNIVRTQLLIGYKALGYKLGYVDQVISQNFPTVWNQTPLASLCYLSAAAHPYSLIPSEKLSKDANNN